jgi:hypothetical protein
VYADAGIPFITGTATNPVITDQGFEQTFRMVARDTLQGEMAAAYLAEHRADQKIAILHDGEGYGQGLAEATRAELNPARRRGSDLRPDHAGSGRLFGRACAARGGRDRRPVLRRVPT